MFPSASVARTAKVYVPSLWSERSYSRASAHGVQSEMTMVSRTSRHERPAPSPWNTHAGCVVADCAGGPEAITGGSGPMRSIVYDDVRVAPVLPAASVARTEN